MSGAAEQDAQAWPETVLFHLTSPFRTLMNIHSEQASAFPAASFELIDGALSRAETWPVTSEWRKARNGFERYATISQDDVTLFAQPLFILTVPDAVVAEAMAAIDADLLPEGAAIALTDVQVRLFDNTIAVTTAALSATVADAAGFAAVLERIDALSTALSVKIAQVSQEQARRLVEAMIAQESEMRRMGRLPIDLVRRPGAFLAFADVNFADTEWEQAVRAEYRWPMNRDSHLWTNRILFVDRLHAARRRSVARHWKVSALDSQPIPNVPSIEACVNIGNSIFEGPYADFLGNGLAETMARVQFFYAQLDVIRDNARSIYSELYENVPLKRFRKQREKLSRINAQINFIVSELSDYRLGVQGARRWYFEQLHACFHIDLLVESVRLKQQTVQERASDLQTELFARMDGVIETLVFVLSTLTLIDVTFALMSYAKGGYAPGEAGEWTAGPVSWLRHLSSDLTLTVLLVATSMLAILYVRKLRR